MTTGTSPAAELEQEVHATVALAPPLRDEDRLGAKREEGVVWSAMVCVGSDAPWSIRSRIREVNYVAS